jgi:hypothetical protein
MAFIRRLGGIFRNTSSPAPAHPDESFNTEYSDIELSSSELSISQQSNSELGDNPELSVENAITALCPDLQQLVDGDRRLFPYPTGDNWPPDCWILFQTRGRNECHFRYQPVNYGLTMEQANDQALLWMQSEVD